MANWLTRVLSSLAGAALTACVVSLLEAHGALAIAGAHPPSAVSVIAAEIGALAPLAMLVGVAVAVASAFLEPDRVRSPRERIAALRDQPVLARSRTAALVPLVIAASGAWIVFSAHAAQVLLSRWAPMAAGLALAVTCVASLIGAAALALSLVAPVRRALAAAASTPRWHAALDPAATGVVALAIVLALGLLGTCVGDTGGAGPTPLAIFGVLRRSELDLRPPVFLAIIALCAWLAPAFAGERRIQTPMILASAAIIAVAAAVTVREATALESDAGLAQIIESGAPLGRIALAFDRRATDRDGDGASPFFGGGDCDDRNPRISPTAIDIPGNGVDEDCSGADALPSRPPGPTVATPRAVLPPRMDRKPNLILVTIDTLRAGELGFAGYEKATSPNLDALAARAVVFERAYAMASYTGKALAPMLIGKYPSETQRDGGHFNKYFAGNIFLAERLQSAGVYTMGAASHWYFRESSGVTQGFDTFDLSAMPKAGQTDTDTNSTSAQLTDAAIRLLSANAAGRRFFLWVHYFDPHAQYVPHPDAPDFSDPTRTPSSRMRALYDGEVWYTDRAIGRLLDYAAGQPWGKDTIVAVTSDHGESMGEHGIAFQHGFEIWESLLRIPLLIASPGVEPHRVPVKRSAVDLVPTLLDLMRIPPPAAGELSGRSLLPDLLASAGEPFEERDVYIDMPDGPYTHARRGLIHGLTPGTKLIHFGGRQYRLFDLGADPDEANDLSADASRLAEMLSLFQAKRAELHEVYVRPDSPAPP